MSETPPNLAEDWPEFARYREQNAALLPPAPDEDRVVFFGDSITELWDLGAHFPGKPFVNRGIGGQTTGQLLLRLRPDVILLRPRAVVLLAGTNDIAGHDGPLSDDAIQGNLASMAELCAWHGVRVVLGSILPVHDVGTRIVTDRRDPARIVGMNRWLRRFCEVCGPVYVDYHGAMADPSGRLRPELAEDGLHPGEAGYRIMAGLAQAARQSGPRQTLSGPAACLPAQLDRAVRRS